MGGVRGVQGVSRVHGVCRAWLMQGTGTGQRGWCSVHSVGMVHSMAMHSKCIARVCRPTSVHRCTQPVHLSGHAVHAGGHTMCATIP